MGMKSLVNIDYLRSLIRALTPYILDFSSYINTHLYSVAKTFFGARV
jgi:hypothetical protein